MELEGTGAVAKGHQQLPVVSHVTSLSRPVFRPFAELQLVTLSCHLSIHQLGTTLFLLMRLFLVNFEVF